MCVDDKQGGDFIESATAIKVGRVEEGCLQLCHRQCGVPREQSPQQVQLMLLVDAKDVHLMVGGLFII